MAIVSLVAGIAGLFIFPFIGSIIAVITGHMAKKEISASQGRLTGDGLATGGLVTGYIGLALWICGICAFVAWFIFVVGLAGASSTEWNMLLQAII
jgi:hypothetical protein